MQAKNLETKKTKPIQYTTFKTDIIKLGLVLLIFNIFITKIFQGKDRFVENNTYLPLSGFSLRSPFTVLGIFCSKTICVEKIVELGSSFNIKNIIITYIISFRKFWKNLKIEEFFLDFTS